MTKLKNVVLDLSGTLETVELLGALVGATKGKGEGRIKCTVTKHRMAKTAILLGIAILLKKPPSIALDFIQKWAPLRKKGKRCVPVKANLVLECSSTQGFFEGVDKIWKQVGEAVSHRRVMKACLCIGLDSLNKVDPGKVRLLVSRLSPVQTKYWDPELDQLL
jgi:hypothetical protein